MRQESLAHTLRALDTLTGAQSAVIDAELERVCGSLPPGLRLQGLKRRQTSSWTEVEGRDVLMIPLRGHPRGRGWIVSCFDHVREDQRPTLESLYRLARLAEGDLERVVDEYDEMRLMFQAVLDTIPVRVFWKDLNSTYLGSNRLFAQDCGFDTPDELIGKSDYEMSFHEQAELYRADDHRVMTTGEAKINYEEPQTTPTGGRIWLQTSKIPIRDVGHEIVGVLGTYTDITPRKEAEAEREELLADLGSKNAELERFTYTVSHDLKSPLVTIGGFLGVLEKELRKTDAKASQVSQRAYDSIARIKKAAFKMGQLLDELLEISRVGRILRPTEPVELRSLLDDALLLCDGALCESGADLQIQGEFPVVQVDGPRIVQVLQNLVENACKYRSSEEPLTLQISGRSDGSLSLRDNGIGIPEEYHERVFRIFEKLDPTTEGSGIGLALVQRILETHGGSIRIESAGHGHGTTFHLKLPLAEG